MQQSRGYYTAITMSAIDQEESFVTNTILRYFLNRFASHQNEIFALCFEFDLFCWLIRA